MRRQDPPRVTRSMGEPGGMKCERCGMELDLVEVLERERVWECGECAYTLTLKKGFSPKILYDGPPPLDYYYHD